MASALYDAMEHSPNDPVAYTGAAGVLEILLKEHARELDSLSEQAEAMQKEEQVTKVAAA